MIHRLLTSALAVAAICAPVAATAANDAVNPGDQLQVTVFNHPELSGQVKVDSKGGISVPVAGYFTVAGQRLKAIDDRIAAKLGRYFKYPAVDVQSIGETESIFVAGGPGGVLVFSPGETLATVLADVQKNLQHADPQDNNRLELTDVIDRSRLDLHTVGVERFGKSIGVFDTIAMRSTGDPGPMLHANDTVVFRNKPVSVMVTGYVSKPGYAYLNATEPLSDAIDQTGGTLPTAASSHVSLTDADGTSKLVALGDIAFTEPARPGETIMVPAAPRVQVNGLVAKPGPVSLQSDFTLLGAINTAGGINKYANIKDVSVVHAGQVKTFDITRLTFGDMSQDPMLADGDSVFVPEGHKIDFSAVFSDLVGVRQFLPYYTF